MSRDCRPGTPEWDREYLITPDPNEADRIQCPRCDLPVRLSWNFCPYCRFEIRAIRPAQNPEA